MKLSVQSFHNARMRTSAKPHNCKECGRTINRYERYEYAAGIQGGNFYTTKTCLDCVESRDSSNTIKINEVSNEKG